MEDRAATSYSVVYKSRHTIVRSLSFFQSQLPTTGISVGTGGCPSAVEGAHNHTQPTCFQQKSLQGRPKRYWIQRAPSPSSLSLAQQQLAPSGMGRGGRVTIFRNLASDWHGDSRRCPLSSVFFSIAPYGSACSVLLRDGSRLEEQSGFRHMHGAGKGL